MTDTTVLAAQLATWARGTYTDEAAVKLLADTGMLRKVAHLVRHTERYGEPWSSIDWEEAAEWFKREGTMSGGEARVVAAALSIAEALPVNLGDVITGIDHTNARHVLAALEHAAGLDR